MVKFHGYHRSDEGTIGRLTAVVVVAVVLDGVLGGLRLAAAAGSTAQFDRVTQLAVLGQQVTGLAHAMEDERDQTAGFIADGRLAAGRACRVFRAPVSLRG